MPPPSQRRFWRRCRIYFRRARISVWLLLLLLLGALLYVNQAGLPGPLQRPLLERLRERGVDLRFSRLRWRWFEGVVADQVRFGGLDDPGAPELSAAQVRLKLGWRSSRPHVQLEGLVLRDGRLTLPLAHGQLPRRALEITNLQTDLRMLPGDRWALDNFNAGFAGVRLRLSGAVTNASKVRDWSKATPSTATRSGQWERILGRIDDLRQSLEFAGAPELRVTVAGDALDPRSFEARVFATASAARSPWGRYREVQLTGRLFPATGGVSVAELRLDAAEARTPWGTVTNFTLNSSATSAEGETNLVRGRLALSADGVRTRWAVGRHAALEAEWLHSITNPVPLSGTARFEGAQIASRWGAAQTLELRARLAEPAGSPGRNLDSRLGWWTNLWPYRLELAFTLNDARYRELRLDDLTCSGSWNAPLLVVSNFNSSLYRGQASVAAQLEVVSRRLTAQIDSSVDPIRVAAALPEAARRWLEDFEWSAPPQVRAAIGLTLPAWTNRASDWLDEARPTLELSGDLTIPTNAAYRGLEILGASGHADYSNRCWHLSALRLRSAAGELAAEHHLDERTQEFSWRFHSTIRPERLRPLLPADGQKALDLFQFSSAPWIEGEIAGRYSEPQTLSAAGRVAVTNFFFHGEPLDRVETRVGYTNRAVHFGDPFVVLDGRTLRAESVVADFAARRVRLDQARGVADPMRIARMIGPHIAETLQPYQFATPPRASVSGDIPMEGEIGADVWFRLDGGPFHWWKVNLPQIQADLRWKDESLLITNAHMTLYHGWGTGWAHFDFPRRQPAAFQFELRSEGVRLEALMADLSSQPNHLEGDLDSSISITRANTESTESVFGYGEVQLRDGLLWDIPMFGKLTPVLDSISPGLGHARASAGRCGFVITNGVILSEDLEIRAPTMRLQYRGTVDLHERVKARVEAELMRDMWVVGPLVSTVLWPFTKMFEYKVTGTLGDPKLEPVYFLPKLLAVPLHPFRALKSMLPEDRGSRSNPGEGAVPPAAP